MNTNATINTIQKRAKPEDTWEYNGQTLFVVFMQLGSHFTHWNGYVLTDTLVEDDAIYDIEVHGGITLQEYGEPANLYGFDTMHADDILSPKSREWTMNETERFADALTAWQLAQSQPSE